MTSAGSKNTTLGQFFTFEPRWAESGKVASGKGAAGDTALHGTEASAQHTSGRDLLAATQARI